MSEVYDHYEKLPAEDVKSSFLRLIKLFDKKFTEPNAVIGAAAAALYIVDEVENNDAVQGKYTFTQASTANGEIGDWEVIVRKLL